MSGNAKPGAEGAADFAELLKGSQNINAGPGNVSETKGKPAADDTAEAASDGSGITFYSDNENGEPGDGETAEAGEGEALLPLSVLSGETGEDAAKTGLPSTIDQLTPVTAAKPDLAAVATAGTAAVAAEGQADTTAALPEASQGEMEIATSILLKGNAATAPAQPGNAAENAAPVQGEAAAAIVATSAAAAETKTAAALAADPALAEAQGDAAKPVLTGAQQAVAETAAGQQVSADAEDVMAALQSTETATAQAKDIAKQLAPGQQAALAAAAKADETTGAAVASAARMANGSLSDTGAETTAETVLPDTQAVKAAVQNAIANAERGQTANGQAAPLTGGEAQAAATATDTIETGTDTPALDSVIDEALSLDGAATDALEPDFMQQTATTTAAAAISAAQQADAQASASAPQTGVVTVQAGEMGETVATATSGASNATAAARNLQMAEPDWPVNLSSMIRAAQEMGQSEIEIALQPEKLGKMTIKLDMRDSSNVAVNIVTETDAAARMLNDNQSRLAEMMQKAGLDLTQHHASSGQGFQDQSGQGGQAGRNSGPGTDSWQNSSEDDMTAHSMQASPDKGIDIIA